MDRHACTRLLVSIAVGCACLVASSAEATFHLWTIEEAFSNADGTIQYVEFHATVDGQHLMLNHVLQSMQGATVLHSFTFPSNLPNSLTATHFFLVATPDFAAVAGIQPDYVLPPGRFIELGLTNTLTLVGAFTPAFAFTPAALPKDGIHSLASVGGVVQEVLASPTNLAGQMGTMEPACSDGVDNDADGATDFPADPGCHDAAWTRENPACQDGVDNDHDTQIDFDGGAFLNGGTPIAAIDSQCAGKPHRNREAPDGCGEGNDLAFVAPVIWWVGHRRRRGQGR